jgi:hypothetical protein
VRRALSRVPSIRRSCVGLHSARATALCLCAALLVISGCTTSRAIRAWHDAEDALAAGNRAKAVDRYSEAYGRDSGLVGAEANRIALLARDPAATARVAEAYDALATQKAGRVEVVLLGAGLDALAGRAKEAFAAASALDAAVVAKADRTLGALSTSCGALWRNQQLILLDTSLALHRPAPATAAADRLFARCATSLRPREAMLIANAALAVGDATRALAVIARLDAADPHARRLRATLHLRLGEPAAAQAALAGLHAPADELLSAQAALALGDAAAAGAALSAARNGGVAEAELLPVEGALALLTGDARRGRDLLAGLVARRDTTLRWTTAFDLGLCELQLGDLDAARGAFAVANTLCGGCAPAQRNLDALSAP